MSNFGLIVLAAGGSLRLGTPKQLLPFRRTTLLGHSIEAALGSLCSTVMVVLGAYSEKVLQEITFGPNTRLSVATNRRWQSGVASSIKFGVSALNDAHPNLKGIVLITCDQPFTSSAVIDRLVHQFETDRRQAVASSYAGTIGIPALYHRSVFPDLLDLKGDKGAKGILLERKESISIIEFPDGAYDIDSMEDYANLGVLSSRDDFGTKQ